MGFRVMNPKTDILTETTGGYASWYNRINKRSRQVLFYLNKYCLQNFGAFQMKQLLKPIYIFYTMLSNIYHNSYDMEPAPEYGTVYPLMVSYNPYLRSPHKKNQADVVYSVEYMETQEIIKWWGPNSKQIKYIMDENMSEFKTHIGKNKPKPVDLYLQINPLPVSIITTIAINLDYRPFIKSPPIMAVIKITPKVN